MILPPLTLYIHTPWCIQKCPYCDFNSHTLKQTLPETEYIQALISDLNFSLPQTQGRSIQSIFIGGGTPSLFSPSAIEYLLKTIQKKIPFEPHIEITLEANPGTVEQKHFKGFFSARVNRLSIGIQSFNDQHLQTLGRIHGSLEARTAIEAAKLAGFKQVNIDLMYALPQQTVPEAISDLEIATSFKPEHISWYQLTLEENTVFYHHPPTLPSDDASWEMLKLGQAYLASQNYLQYEVSAYAKNHKVCKHNLNYWEFGDYLGIGAGACSKITDTTAKHIYRIQKYKHPKQYLMSQQNFISSKKIIPMKDLPLEFMMNALRLNQPLNIAQFEARTGLPIQTLQTVLNQAVQQGFLSIHQDTIQRTEQGALFLNDLIEMFMQ